MVQQAEQTRKMTTKSAKEAKGSYSELGNLGKRVADLIAAAPDRDTMVERSWLGFRIVEEMKKEEKRMAREG